MGQLAASPHGELIHKLALYLVMFAPGDDLEIERRGLEVPYQAMQTFYATPAISEYGGGELKRARQLGKKRRSLLSIDKSPAVNVARAEHPPLIPQPIDCERFQCMYVDTPDYQLSQQGGYVVKSLSPRLSLSHNYARPPAHGGDDDAHAAALTHKGLQDGVVKPKDDGAQVGDCFGRCGGGCGNWRHEWVGTPNIEYGPTSCREGYRNPAMEVVCLERCEEESVNPVTYRGTAVHTASGKVTLGAKAHDSCCRSSPLGCADPACIAIAPLAIDCIIPGVGSEHTWSYIGYHEAQYVEFGADPWTCHEQMSECCQQWY